MEIALADLSNWLIIVPARLESTRLPRKLLQDLGGQPLIVRVRERLAPCESSGAKVIVATDSQEIAEACEHQGFRSVLTGTHHRSGTDRCLEAAQSYLRDVGESQEKKPTFVMNVQGDEPFVDTGDLSRLAAHMEGCSSEMGTLWRRSTDPSDYKSNNTVKVVIGAEQRALYFSRSPIPNLSRGPANAEFEFREHIGIYAYRLEALKSFCSLPPSAIEVAESLEQLRALDAGMRIDALETTNVGIGIDTEEDLERARAHFLQTSFAD